MASFAASEEAPDEVFKEGPLSKHKFLVGWQEHPFRLARRGATGEVSLKAPKVSPIVLTTTSRVEGGANLEKGLGLRVTEGRRSLTLRAGTAAERDAWVQALRNAAKQATSARLKSGNEFQTKMARARGRSDAIAPTYRHAGRTLYGATSFQGTGTKGMGAWLKRHGVDQVQQWGTGKAKTLDSLLEELKRGDCVLEVEQQGRAVRVAHVLRAKVRRTLEDPRVLIEESQRLPDGRVRERRRLLAEKMRLRFDGSPLETLPAAGARAVLEELGYDAGGNAEFEARTQTDTLMVTVDYASSPSYPSLDTKYVLHTVEILCPALPQEDFSTTEEEGSDKGMRHDWKWYDAQALDELYHGFRGEQRLDGSGGSDNAQRRRSVRRSEAVLTQADEQSMLREFEAARVQALNDSECLGFAQLDNRTGHVVWWKKGDGNAFQRIDMYEETRKRLAAAASAQAAETSVRTTFDYVHKLNAGAQDLLEKMFEGHERVRVRKLHGGFSGSLVLQTESLDAQDHLLEASVIKVDQLQAVKDERERMNGIRLGANAPRVIDMLELDDGSLAALRIELCGACWSLPGIDQPKAHIETFKQLFERSSEAAGPVLNAVSEVFAIMHGPTCAESTEGGTTLVEHYDLAKRVRKNVLQRKQELDRKLQKTDASIKADTEKLYNEIEDLDAFATTTLPSLAGRDYFSDLLAALPSAAGSGKPVRDFFGAFVEMLARDERPQMPWRQGTVHGDLNGANVLIDLQNVVWIIDFAFTGTAHVLKDLAKLENTILFEYAELKNQDDFACALEMTERLASSTHLTMAPPLPPPSLAKSPHLGKVWDVIARLRKLAAHFATSASNDDRAVDATQLHVPRLRYALDTISFRETKPLNRLWALISAMRHALAVLGKPTPTLRLAQRLAQRLATNDAASVAMDHGLADDRDLLAAEEFRYQRFVRHRLEHFIDPIGHKAIRLRDQAIELELRAKEEVNRLDVETEGAKESKEDVDAAEAEDNGKASAIDEVVETPLLDAEALNRLLPSEIALPRDRLVITASAGHGKSVLLKKMTLSAVPDHEGMASNKKSLVPVLILTIELSRTLDRAYQASTQAVLDPLDLLLRERHGERSLQYRFLVRARQEKRMLVLLDGLDEAGHHLEDAVRLGLWQAQPDGAAAQPGWAVRLRKDPRIWTVDKISEDGVTLRGHEASSVPHAEAETWWSPGTLVAEGLPVVVSSRPSVFPPGGEKQRLAEAFGFRALGILPLNPTQVNQMVAMRFEAHEAELRAHVLEQVRSARYQDLARTPLMLSLLIYGLTTSFKQGKQGKQRAGLSMKRLYDLGIDQMLHRTDAHKVLRRGAKLNAVGEELKELASEAAKALLRRISWKFHREHRRDCVAGELVSLVRDGTEARMLDIMLRHALQGRVPLFEITHGRLRSEVQLRIPHLSFQEHLGASQLVEELLEDGTLHGSGRFRAFLDEDGEDSKRSKGLFAQVFHRKKALARLQDAWWQPVLWRALAMAVDDGAAHFTKQWDEVVARLRWKTSASLRAFVGYVCENGSVDQAGLLLQADIHLPKELDLRSLHLSRRGGAVVGEVLSNVKQFKVRRVRFGARWLDVEALVGHGDRATEALVMKGGLLAGRLSDVDCAAMAPMLALNGTVTSLDVQGNRLDAAALGTLGRAVQKATMNVDGTDLDVVALRGDTEAESMDLSQVKVGVETAIMIAEWVVEENKFIKFINFDGYALPIQDIRGGTTNKKSLDFSQKGLTKNSAILIARFLADNKSLASLDLKRNEIGDDGAQFLAEGIKASKSLAFLILGDNKIGADGAKFLAEGIKASKSLAWLDLFNNDIGADGAKFLADGIKASKSLASLDLGFNEIGDDGAKYLAEGIAASKSLSVLGLAKNNIGADGAKFLAEGIKASKSLSNLNLRDNKIGDDGAKYLAEGIKASKSLSKLDLLYNDLSEASKTLLKNAKSENLEIIF